jgi:hypothetical protein
MLQFGALHTHLIGDFMEIVTHMNAARKTKHTCFVLATNSSFSVAQPSVRSQNITDVFKY